MAKKSKKSRGRRLNRSNRSTCEFAIFADRRGKFSRATQVVAPDIAKPGDLLGVGDSLSGGSFPAHRMAELIAARLEPGRKAVVFQYCSGQWDLPDRVMTCKRTKKGTSCVVQHRRKRRKKLQRPATQARRSRWRKEQF